MRIFNRCLYSMIICCFFLEGHTQEKIRPLKKEKKIQEKIRFLRKVESLKFFVRTGVPGFNFEGRLKRTLSFNKKSSNLYLSIPSSELTTDLSLRDRHMYEKIFKKKDIQFLGMVKCRSVKCRGSGRVKIGNEEKKIKFSLKKKGRYFEISHKIKLSDFSIDPPEFMGVKVDNEILVVILVY